MGVVFAENIAHNAGALSIRPIWGQPQFVHCIEDPSLNRLEAVAGIRQGSSHDHAHGVLEVGALHLLMQGDRLNALLGHPRLELLRADGGQPTDVFPFDQPSLQGVLLGSALASARLTASLRAGLLSSLRVARRSFTPQS